MGGGVVHGDRTTCNTTSMSTDSHDFGSAESPAVARSCSCFNTLARSVVRGIVKEFAAVNYLGR